MYIDLLMVHVISQLAGTFICETHVYFLSPMHSISECIFLWISYDLSINECMEKQDSDTIMYTFYETKQRDSIVAAIKVRFKV